MGGRGGSSGISGNSTHDKNGLLKNTSEYSGYDANKLSGTQKQKEYAQDIIDKAFKNVNDQIEKIRQEKGKLLTYKGRAETARVEANAAIQSYLDIKKVFVTSLNGKMNDAGKVIKNKGQFENALPSIREALEVKYQNQFWDEIKKRKKK